LVKIDRISVFYFLNTLSVKGLKWKWS